MRAGSSCGSGAKFVSAHAVVHKELVLQVTARRTYRLTDSAREAFMRSAAIEQTPVDGGAMRVAWADAAGTLYIRSTEPVPGAEALPEGTEIFVCSTLDTSAAQQLLDLLRGPGGVAAVQSCTLDGRDIIVELARNIPLLFAFIDVHARALGPVRRHALLPLHDATILQIAEYAWNCRTLEPMRILEVAAGDDVW